MVLFTLIIALNAAALPTDGKLQNTNSKTVKREDTGWSIDGDRWVWGYADIVLPRVNKPTQPRVNIPKITSQINMTYNQIDPKVMASLRNEEDLYSSYVNLEIIFDPKLREILKGNATIGEMIANFCSPYYQPVPDFSAPGRRISDVKCEEYVWNIRYENYKALRIQACDYLKSLNDKRGYPSVGGGHITKPGEFPHMGAIGWRGINGDWQFKCGSSLISPKFVLTAAHCTRASERDTSLADPVPQIVRLSHKNIFLGLPIKSAGNFDVSIINIITYPEYRAPRQYYDIAIMELQRSVGLSQLVQPACLWGYSDINRLGAIATVTGWGVLTEGSLDISPELQAAELDIIESGECSQYLQNRCNRNWCGVQEHQLCAGILAGGVDACQGDSGSPLQVKIPLDIETAYNIYYVIGVTSFGVGCAQPNLPGIYSRVSSFIDWIEDIVWLQ